MSLELESVINVLYKSIESQNETTIRSTESQERLIAELKSLKNIVIRMDQSMSDLNDHFSNGFRSELKQHISEELSEVNTRLDEVINPKFLIKLWILGVGVIASIAGIVSFLVTALIT